ncbi:spermine oxidase-like [Micractinium conductrix]|uniref:Spermine oxidase-like n=1 Tax=Micractinium conductrix TaxID=554055 RepID=A0A2P6V8S5_9CHLO|nr:spermine oxidase-like [Micractinium conductrix]|eukprot:PSC70494.1 spermine oxidase-like [Micractinium conductrix]
MSSRGAPATAALRTAAAAAAAAAAPPRPRVAVIGAGFAGLEAALTLQTAGQCDVMLLEAGARPGGRAWTLPLPAGSAAAALELGATWLHGLGSEGEPNPVFRHAVELGLIESNPTAERWWSSQFCLPGEARPLSLEEQAVITHALAAWGEAVEGLQQDEAGTTADALRAAWAALLASGRLGDAGERLQLAGRSWRWRELLQRAMDGCDSTSVQSAQGLALYDEMPGGVHAAMPGGMQGVAEGLAARVHDLRYGHAVQCIRWGGAGHAGPVSIACANGAAVEADAVVVTVSLGVLKAQHKALFEPALPLTKQDAIQRLSIGTVDKLLLDLAPGSASSSSGSGSGGGSGGGGSGDGGSVSGGRASGSAEAVSFALLWSEPWQGFGGSTSASASACVDSPPAAAPAPGEAQLPGWARGVFSIRFGGPEFKQRSAASAAAGVAQQAQQAAAGDAGRTGEAAEGHQEEFNPRAQAQQPRTYQAVAWLTGAEAAAMEAASDEEVLGTLRRLAEVFPALQLPPGASWDRVQLHRSRWGSDPLFRGSYSYLGPGSSPADVAALQAPVEGPDGGAPRVLFAGEACHVKYIGTMHGAALTGRLAAQTLLQHWSEAPAGQQRERHEASPG